MNIHILKLKRMIENSYRVVLLNAENNEVIQRILLGENHSFKFEYEFNNEAMRKFKYKVQYLQHNNWYDKTKYSYLFSLSEIFNSNLEFKEDDLETIINANYESFKKVHLRQAINTAVKVIQDPNLAVDNIERYLKVTDEIDHQLSTIPSIWLNINGFIKGLLILRNYMIENNLFNVSYESLKNPVSKRIYNFRTFLYNEALKLEEANLPFANFLAGRHLSMLDNRKRASINFKKYRDFESPIDLLLFDVGLSTYFENSQHNNVFVNTPIFLGNIKEKSKYPVILVSVDTNFLRKYGTQMFHQIISFKKYQVHIHVIGVKEIVLKTIDEAQELFNVIENFYNTTEDIVAPSYSYESVPSFVKDEITYFACSRFIHIESFREKFNADLLILDIDFTFIDDFSNLHQKLKQFDIGLSVTIGMTAMSPWTRIMGGTLYVKNKQDVSKFTDSLREYILKGLSLENSWILDQNALSFAFEESTKDSTSIKFFNIPPKLRPYSQFRIRYFTEESRKVQ